MYISSAATLDMLSVHAPRAWCKRLLSWMAQTKEISVLFQKGKVTDTELDFSENNLSTPIYTTEVLSEWDGEYWMLGPPQILLYAERIDWESGSLRSIELNTSEMDWGGRPQRRKRCL